MQTPCQRLHSFANAAQAHDSALQSEPSAADADAAFAPALSSLIDPLLEAAARSGEPLKARAAAGGASAAAGGRPDATPAGAAGIGGTDPADAPAVYAINCAAALQARLAPHACAAAVAAKLESEVERHVADLVTGAAGRVLAAAGMADVADRVRFYRTQPLPGAAGSVESSSGGGGGGGAPLAAPAQDAALSLTAVTDAMRRFFAYLSSADALPEFPALQQPRLRAEAAGRVAASLAGTYELVYSTLEDPTCGYLELGGAAGLKHGPAQVRTILGVL